MLDPILNINHNERYKGGVKSQSNIYSIHKHTDEKNTTKDSALFSPLARLLSKIKWQIINIQYPSADQILLNFQKGDLEFLTLIDFHELYINPYHEFSIFKKEIKNNKDLVYQIQLKVQKEKIDTFEKITPLEIEGLEEVFARISKINPGNLNDQPFTLINSQLLNNLIYGLEDKIYDELNTILTAIYTLISTQQSNKIRKNYELNIERNNPIMLKRVSIIGA